MNVKLLGVIILTLAPSLAAAQSRPRLGVFGAVEQGDFGLTGPAEGIGWTGGLEWLLTEKTTLEVEVGQAYTEEDLVNEVFIPADRTFQRSPRGERAVERHTTLTLRLARVFYLWRVQPMGSIGGGLMRESWERIVTDASLLPPGGQEDPTKGEITGFAVDVGVGVHIVITKRIGVRPFAGFRTSSKENIPIRRGVRIAVRW